jgi:5-bromo-4-chloroindolyl phosphate hydrolysis protein
VTILFEHNKNYKKELIIPEKVIKRTNEYIEASVEIFEWFKSQFEKVENYKNEDFISFQDINNLLKLGEYYQTLSKIDKRKLTREKLVNLFKENSLYNKYYRDDVNTHIDGIKVNLPKRLIGFKIKDEI